MKISLESFEQFTKTLDPNILQLSRGGAYFGGGVLVGILVKQSLRLFVLSAIVCFFIIKGLEYKHILNIDWGVLNQIVGLRPSTTINELALLCYSWSIKNLNESIPSVAGFFVGFYIV